MNRTHLFIGDIQFIAGVVLLLLSLRCGATHSLKGFIALAVGFILMLSANAWGCES